MSEIVTRGTIWGIDHSSVMVRQASRRNRQAISDGRMKIVLGSVTGIGEMGIHPEKVLDINSFQFWQSPLDDLMNVRAAMAEGGIIALVHQPRKPGSTDADAVRAGREFSDYLRGAGFKDVSVQAREMKPVSTICILGTK